jgi:hypothetical protein
MTPFPNGFPFIVAVCRSVPPARSACPFRLPSADAAIVNQLPEQSKKLEKYLRFPEKTLSLGVCLPEKTLPQGCFRIEYCIVSSAYPSRAGVFIVIVRRQ